MPNIGLAPLPDSPVGIVRALIGDTEAIALSPEIPGYGDYAHFSDTELTAFILLGGGKPLRAAGHAYIRLSANAIAESRNIATDDLRISTEKRAADWLALSKVLFGQADAADEADNSASDFFEIAGFSGRPEDSLFDFDFENAPAVTPALPYGLVPDPENPGYYK